MTYFFILWGWGVGLFVCLFLLLGTILTMVRGSVGVSATLGKWKMPNNHLADA